MAKKFDIPPIYQSSIISRIKQSRQVLDPRKKTVKPEILDFGPLRFLIPRHFGFCYGVENAIDIAYRTIEQNPGKNIYLLSEMIHNPSVNRDLQSRGVRYLFDTAGRELIPLSSLNSEDIVIVPAFGTTLEIQKKLAEQGIDAYRYDTTCPFVEKVWKRGKQLGRKGNTLVIHGKHRHEETRATFSHTAQHARCVVVLNPGEARILAELMLGKRPPEDFDHYFGEKCTPGFDPHRDMEKFGVINQTTMLASETREVMQILKQAAIEKYGEPEADEHFADTSDTLCYATNDNQSAVFGLLEEEADLALVVGGYNSSNTMHLVELLERKFPTYHIRDASEIKSVNEIRHFDQWDKEVKKTGDWLPVSFSTENSGNDNPAGTNGNNKSGGPRISGSDSQCNDPDAQDKTTSCRDRSFGGIRADSLAGARPVTIALTSGASCPDSLVDEVILKVAGYFENCRTPEEALNLNHSPH